MLRKEKPCSFDGCMARLNDLVRRREVGSHEDVDIRTVVVLGELHGVILSKRNRGLMSLIKFTLTLRACKALSVMKASPSGVERAQREGLSSGGGLGMAGADDRPHAPCHGDTAWPGDSGRRHRPKP